MLENLAFAVLLEEGTNPIEFDFARLRLKEAGAGVVVIGTSKLEYRLEDHSRGYADITADRIGGTNFDGVLIPGGLGPEKLRQDSRIVDLVRNCYSRGRVCAAICHGQLVLISTGLMRGIKATAAWSMQDDLRMAGAVVSEGKRVVRDGCIITAMFPRDLPAFFQMILVAVSETEHRPLPAGYPQRLAGQRWGIVVDDASDSVQVHYLQLRISEEGGKPVILGSRAGAKIRLGSPAWEWGQIGSSIQTDRGLPNPGVVSSCDTEADLNSLAVTANELDGLILPGGLATWMIRGHTGLRGLIEEMNDRGKPLCAIGRGVKRLFMTKALEGRTITCAPQMKDDIIHAIHPVEYSDKPAERDGNLLTCQGSEHLPEMMQLLLAAYGKQGR